MEHEGIIIAVEHHTVCIEIKQSTACSACNARRICGAADMQTKIVETPLPSGDYRIGDTVRLVGTATMGLQAVVYAFVLPLLAICATLIAVLLCSGNEAMASIGALSVGAVYYLSLSLFKEKIKQKFIFTINT
ncbi:MAG: SoxR reducing system RseC family protein [Candidatus Symbiothrix sp.]|jgi:sigma-E factor negative regulatory protein RseC|nr:SoxR reducing system RseC family protein [Candidatus Symbiothrix sp.]